MSRGIFIFLILSLCFIIFFCSRWIWPLNQVRRKGLYPKEGRATLFSVRQLLLKGEKETAIVVYTQIFKVGHSEATRAVEELERSLQRKT